MDSDVSTPPSRIVLIFTQQVVACAAARSSLAWIAFNIAGSGRTLLAGGGNGTDGDSSDPNQRYRIADGDIHAQAVAASGAEGLFQAIDVIWRRDPWLC